ncbi:hypothetical protein CASFOL_020667 [Castilleja foliolosa]|uniref:Aminotransferase-like plant mobile domain-containing protein n=1 Tax=Castilleja foliolosa TaxID=1961234 RepID=A0ABD3D1H6_9LAMI
MALLTSWYPPNSRIVARIQHTCLYEYATNVVSHLKSHEKLINLQSDLIGFLVDAYDKSNSTFVIDTNKLYFGLEDIYYITGLPIMGNAICPKNEDFDDVILSLLGVERSEVGADQNSAEGSVVSVYIWLAKLRNKFYEFPDEADIEVVDRYARAYLLYIIGTIVFPAVHRSQVPIMYLELIANFDEINSYAWGAGMLAHIHQALMLINNQKVLSAPALPLCIFAMVRLPSIAKYYNLLSVDDFPNDFPLVNGWVPIMSNKKDTMNSIQLSNLTKIEKFPYSRVKVNVPSEKLPNELIMVASMPIICGSRIWYYRSEFAEHQISSLPIYCSENLDMIGSQRNKKCKLMRGARNRTNWVVEYEKEVAQWERVQEIVRGIEPTKIEKFPYSRVKVNVPSEKLPNELIMVASMPIICGSRIWYYRSEFAEHQISSLPICSENLDMIGSQRNKKCKLMRGARNRTNWVVEYEKEVAQWERVQEIVRGIEPGAEQNDPNLAIIEPSHHEASAVYRLVRNDQPTTSSQSDDLANSISSPSSSIDPRSNTRPVQSRAFGLLHQLFGKFY